MGAGSTRRLHFHRYRPLCEMDHLAGLGTFQKYRFRLSRTLPVTSSTDIYKLRCLALPQTLSIVFSCEGHGGFEAGVVVT